MIGKEYSGPQLIVSTDMVARMTAEIIDLAEARSRKAEASSLAAAEILKVKLCPGRKPGLSDIVSVQEERWADHRCVERQPMETDTHKAVKLGGTPAVIENISDHGLMACADIDEDIGAPVFVAIGGGKAMPGRLVWKRGGKVGIEVPNDSLPAANA